MNWTISRALSRDRKGYHIQARTDDQMNSFATVIGPNTPIYRGKTPDGKLDVITITQLEPHVTFNIVGKIKYVQFWDGV